jgi:pyruvate/2-oxoglutarate dehydrogenase complex dihydrolipoamide acyltransferase (E2) component
MTRASNAAAAGGSRGDYQVQRLPAGRRDVLDLLRYASRVPVVHGLLEVDVSRARQQLRQRAEPITFTTFVVASVGRAVDAHPEINVRRAGAKLVRFERIDVVVTAEHQAGGTSLPLPHVVRDAGRRTVEEIGADLRRARQRADGLDTNSRPRTTLERVPGVLRGLGLRAAVRLPSVAARLGPAIGVSSLGMFGDGIAWGVPVSPLTLMVTVGSIGRRPYASAAADREVEVLPLTLSFDHSVVDGGPAARFATTLRTVLEQAVVLEGVGPH